MITGRRSALEARCRERGYTLDDIRACIVHEDGDIVTVDERHPDYPRAKEPPPLPPQGGPGSELKKILGRFGITATPNCSCNAKAKQMDEWGPDECQKRLPEIVDWLAGEAARRGLPFVRFVAEQAVKHAIRRARSAAAR